MLPPRIIADETRRGWGVGLGTEGHAQSGLLMNELTTVISDGGVLVSVTLGDVVLRKVVYSDGRFHVQIEVARDRLAFAGSAGRASLTYGADTVSFVPSTVVCARERARQLVSSANVVTTFRRFAERLGRLRGTSPGAVSVHLTTALVGEVMGEKGVAALVERLVSAPVPPRRVVYDGRDDFQDRWTEHTIARLGSPDTSTLELALHTLLVMEASWHAVVSRDSEARSRAVR
jgi:hypothetical protein